MNAKILVQRYGGAPANFRMPSLLIVAQAPACFLIECGKQIEGDIRRLIMLRIGSRYVRRK